MLPLFCNVAIEEAAAVDGLFQKEAAAARPDKTSRKDDRLPPEIAALSAVLFVRLGIKQNELTLLVTLWLSVETECMT